MKIIRPKRLIKGDRVAIVAPASPFDPEEIKCGIEVIEKKGLIPVLGENVKNMRTNQLYAADIKRRTRELMKAFLDKNVAGIFVAGGGLGSEELLPFLDYKAIKEHPKIFMGFSDITALNNGIFAKTGLVNFNGPSISMTNKTKHARKMDVISLNDVLNLLMSDEKWEDKSFLQNRRLVRCVSPGKVTGRAIGGNLSTFCGLLGTKYLPECKDKIIFFEDIHEGGYNVEVFLTQLKLAGILSLAKGVVFGEFIDVEKKVNPLDPDIEEVIVRFFQNGPACIFGLNFSHGETTAAIPIGIETKLDATEGKVYFGKPLATKNYVI